MTNRELEIFMEVVECGKMGEAAKKLFISQSSVSQAIASIEKEYGILLFERMAHSLHLTPAGRELLNYARALKNLRNDMDKFLLSARGASYLRIGATVTVGTCVICRVIDEIKAEYPGIELEVEVANTHILEEKILRNEIDIGLVEGKVKSQELKSEEVIDDRLVLICPEGHRFYGRNQISARELEGENLILREQGSGTRALFEDQMNARNVPMRVTWNCYNSEAIKNAVEAGNGLSVISSRLVEKELASGALWGCGIKELNLGRHFSVVYRKNKYITPEMSAFIKACRDFSAKEQT